ncbi:MAG: hypothetical protein MHM6MM_003019 [Cercozoa sp. M6MM]
MKLSAIAVTGLALLRGCVASHRIANSNTIHDQSPSEQEDFEVNLFHRARNVEAVMMIAGLSNRQTDTAVTPPANLQLARMVDVLPVNFKRLVGAYIRF